MTLTDAIIVLAALGSAWCVWTSIYRMLLSPLASLPGPKLAGLTFWYEFYYDVVLGGRYIFKIQELHKKYGPIIRVTPCEIHVNDVEYLDEIYGTANRKRNKDMLRGGGLGVELSLGSTGDHDLHKKRREPLAPFFSMRSILDMEKSIDAKVQQLCQIIDDVCSSEKFLNMSDVYFGFTRDIMEQIVFGEDQNVLGDLKWAARLRHNLYALLFGIHLNRTMPWISKTIGSLPPAISRPLTPPGVVDLVQFGRHTQKIVLKAFDEKTEKSGEHGVIGVLRDAESLPASEKSLARLQHEATLMLMAGVESPAGTMMKATYHVLANPSILAKLREELATVPTPYTLAYLERLPYLAAIVFEANRLNFGVVTRLPRLAPDETLYYHSTFDNKTYDIPPDTPVAMSSLLVHTDESVYPDPWKFNPERWLGDDAARAKKYLVAFGRGNRKCLGINLAQAELKLVLANVFGRYETELYETDARDVAVTADFQVGFPDADRRGEDSGVKVKVKSRLID